MRPMPSNMDEYETPVDEEMKRANADLAGYLDHLDWEENDSQALLEGDHVPWFTSPWSKKLNELPEDEEDADDEDDIYDPEWDEYNSMDDLLEDEDEDEDEDDEDFSYPVVPLSAQRCLGTLDLSGDCMKCGQPGDFLD